MAEKTYGGPINFDTDWGGDASTGGLPVKGERINQFVRENLKKSFRAVYFDSANNNELKFFATEDDKELYLTNPTQYGELILYKVPINLSGVVKQIKMSPVGGTTTLNFTTNQTEALVSLNCVCQQKGLTDTSWEDTNDTMLVRAYVDVGSTGEFVLIQNSEKRIQPNGLYSINIRDYIIAGNNRIKITTIADDDEGTTGNLIYSVYLSEMYIEGFNLDWWTPFIQGKEYSFGGFRIVGALSKTLHLKISKGLNYSKEFTKEIGRAVYTNTPAYFRDIDVPEGESLFPVAGTGVYEVDAWLTSGTLESIHVKYSVMCVTEEDKQEAQLVVVNEKLEKAYNYDQNTLFKYAVYNRGYSTTDPSGPHFLIRAINGVSTATTLKDETLIVETEKSLAYEINLEWIVVAQGNLDLHFAVTYGDCQEVNTIPIDNSGAFEPTKDYNFYFNAANRNNSQANKSKVINEVTGAELTCEWTNITFADGIDGWTSDDTGRSCLRIPAGSKCVIPYKPLTSNDIAFEIAFKIINASNYSDNAITIATNPTAVNFKGIRIKPTNITLHKSSDNTAANDSSQGCNFSDESVNHLFITIDSDYNSNRGFNLVTGYVNGCKNFQFDFDGTVSWNMDCPIEIGSDTADVFVYYCRAYGKALGTSNAETNYINSLPSRADRIIVNDNFNNILDGNHLIDYDKVKNNKYNFFILEVASRNDIPNKYNGWTTSAKTTSNLEMHFGLHPEWDFKVYDVDETGGQGTTSMDYADWNIRWKIKKSTNPKVAYFKTPTTDSAGNIIYNEDEATAIKKLYFDGGHNCTQNSPMVDTITAKINFASSMQSHKIGATRAFNDLHNAVVGYNEAQTIANNQNKAIPFVAVKQYPAFGFAKYKVEGTLDTYSYEYIGLFTIGADKGDKATFGYDLVKDNLVTAEGLDHSSIMVDFRIPWNDNIIYVPEKETICSKNNESGTSYTLAWEISNCADGTDDSVFDIVKREFKPAYDVVYNNSTLIFEVKLGVYGDTAAATLTYINNNVETFAQTQYKPGFTYADYEFYIEGEYILYHKDTITGLYVAGANIFDEFNNSMLDFDKTQYKQVPRLQDTDKWNVDSYYWGAIFNIEGIKRIRIKLAKTEWIAFVESNEVTYNTDVIYYKNITKQKCEANIEYFIDVPTGAKYFYVGVNKADGTTVNSQLTIFKYSIIDYTYKTETVLASNYGVYPLGISDEYNKWYEHNYSKDNARRVIAVDVSNHKKIIVNAKQDNVKYGWLISDNEFTNWYDVKYIDGMTTYLTGLPINSNTILDIPEDAKWFFVLGEGSVVSNIINSFALSDIDWDETFRNVRRNRFKTQAPNYWDINDAIFHNVFVQLVGATDNYAKNTYPYKMKNLEDGGRWKWRQDDLDTIFDIDNQGRQTKPYYIEYNDIQSNVPYFRGTNSAFWTLINEAYVDEIKAIGKSTIESMQDIAGGLNIVEGMMKFYKKYFWDNAQNYFPKSAYNYDASYKYEKAWIANAQTVPPLSQSLGDHYSAEYQWAYMRSIYMCSLYHAGAFGLGNYTDTSLGTIEFRAIIPEFRLKSAIMIYPALHIGKTDINNAEERLIDNTGECVFVNPAGGNDTNIYIPAANWYISLGDLCKLRITGGNDKTLKLTGKRLQEIKVGDEDADEVLINIEGLEIKNTPSLLTLDARNIESLEGSVDLRDCTRIKNAWFDNTNITAVILPDGSKIESLHLSDVIQSIKLRNLTKLTDFELPNYDTIRNLYIDNCTYQDALDLLMSIYNTDNSVLKYIRAIWNDTKIITAETLENLAEIGQGSDLGLYRGIDADGNIDDTKAPIIEGVTKMESGLYIENFTDIGVNFDDIEDYPGGLKIATAKKFGTLRIIYNPNLVFINFADDVVKNICVTNWGSDGGLTLNQASNITTLNSKFKDTSIVTFDEFKNFTGLQNNLAESQFVSTTSLKSITLPNQLTKLGTSYFYLSGVEVVNNTNKVIYLGNSCFYKSGIKKVNFSALETIGTSVFYQCPNLTEIEDLGNITILSGGASSGCFAQCTSLTKITLPNTLIDIQRESFLNCTSLSNIIGGINVQHIGRSAFQQIGEVEEINFPNLTSIDVLVFYKSGIKKVKSLGSITDLPGDASSGIFEWCPNLEEVTLPQSLINIGRETFYYSSVHSYALYGENGNPFVNVENIYRGAFTNGQFTNNIEINAPKLKTLGQLAFYNTNITKIINLGELQIIEGDASVGAFSNCKSLTEATLPQTLTEIKREGFYNDTSLNMIDFSNSSCAIGYNAFNNCILLETITNYQNITSINRGFYNCYELKGDLIFNEVVNLQGDAFYNCKKLTSVSFPKLKTTTLNDFGAFGNCVGLTTVSINSTSLTSIGDKTFIQCSNLKTVNINNLARFTTGYQSFYNCTKLTTIDLTGLTSVGKACFENSGLTGVLNLPNLTGTIPYRAFKKCKITEIANLGSITAINPYITWDGSGYGAFDTCTSLLKVTLPLTCTSISDSTFNSCTSLKEVVNLDNLHIIGSGTFSGCTSLEFNNGELSLPNLTSIGINAFGKCTKLKYVTNLGSITALAGSSASTNGTFQACNNLTYVHLPSTLTAFSDSTNARTPFTNCSNIKTVICEPTTPPTYLGFGNSSPNVYVPNDSLTAYKEDSAWSAIADKIFGFIEVESLPTEPLTDVYYLYNRELYQYITNTGWFKYNKENVRFEINDAIVINSAVDILVYADNTMDFEIKGGWAAHSSPYTDKILGDNSNFFVNVNDGYQHCTMLFIDRTYTVGSSGWGTNKIYSKHGLTLKAYNSTYTLDSLEEFTSTTTLKINRDSSSYPMTFYYCKIWKNNELVRDIIPICYIDNSGNIVKELYDKVDDKTFVIS